MRYIIGIIVGIAIVFNWSSIKTMFDSSISAQGQVTKTESNKAAPPAPVQEQDLSGVVEDRLKAIASGK
jgi:hypothetical protein